LVVCIDIVHLYWLAAELSEYRIIEMALKRNPLEDGFSNHNAQDPSRDLKQLKRKLIVVKLVVSGW
jgi:hypothetical protein